MHSAFRTGEQPEQPDRPLARETTIMRRSLEYPWFVKGDLDGFFGLAVDNLVQVLVIVALCTHLCGFSMELIYTRVLPGIAVSLFIGNIFYALYARRVAKRDNNITCTALPYGINTPSVFAYILFILAPVYARTQDADLAWKVGLLACIGSGIIEFLGAFIGGWIRRVTPRAALLSALAAIAVVFIASPFAFQIFERPLVAIVPMFVVLIGYFAKVRFPRGLPSGLVAVIIGTILAWTIPPALGLLRPDEPTMMSTEAVRDATKWFYEAGEGVKLHLPQHCWHDIVAFFQQDRSMLWAFLGVIIPMGLINAIGSLQNIESAEAAGDRYSTGPCMAVNGIGSVAAGLFGSCFPTTIYIGHPGWKALGARCGYSIINALFFSIIFVLGLGAILVSVIPMEAGIAIVMWIGIIITAQSYEAVPKRHYAAVAIAFFPAVAMMAVFLVPNILSGVGADQGILQMIHSHTAVLSDPNVRTDNWWPIGVYALAGANSGFIITCVIISAVSAFLIDRKFKTAGIWCVVATVVTLLGFQHAYRIEPDKSGPSRQITRMPQELLVWQRSEEFFQDTGLYLKKEPSAYWHRGYRIAAAYAVAAMLLFSIHWMRQKGTAFEDIGVDGHAPPEPETTLPPREAAEVDYERRLKNVALPGSAKAPDTPVG
jgi:AGZA family xanthine/uracil permease-like MFS transporter